MNHELNQIAAIGWTLQGGNREVGHGLIMFTFVRK